MLQKAAKIAVILENSERSVRGVRMGKSGPVERVELASQIQGFRIPDLWDASEKIKGYICPDTVVPSSGCMFLQEFCSRSNKTKARSDWNNPLEATNIW